MRTGRRFKLPVNPGHWGAQQAAYVTNYLTTAANNPITSNIVNVVVVKYELIHAGLLSNRSVYPGRVFIGRFKRFLRRAAPS